jgi:hypothetical protein
MKKIVGIIAAVAMATSLFAADVQAATKIEGNLFNYAGKTATLLTEKNGSQDWAQPNFQFGLAGDKAGATVKITTKGNVAPELTTQTIWFKPVDALKITAGNYDVALNKEQIDWTESVTGLGGNGFLVSIGASGLAIDLGFAANNADWLTIPEKGDATIGNLFAKFAYSADFGNIGAYFALNKGGSYKAKKGSVNDINFGAGYRNNFNGIDLFFQVAGCMGDKFDWIRPELYVSGSADAFGYQLFAAPKIAMNDGGKTEVEVVAKVTYAIDGVTAYAYFKDTNLLADQFTSTIKLGAQGSCGAMGWNTWFQINVAKETSFAVPFELTISF